MVGKKLYIMLLAIAFHIDQIRSNAIFGQFDEAPNANDFTRGKRKCCHKQKKHHCNKKPKPDPKPDPIIGRPSPNNFLAFYRMGRDGSFVQIQPSQIRGPNVAIVTHGITLDVTAMPVLSAFLANFHKNNDSAKGFLYSDVIAFQYDSYHTSLVTTAQFLANKLEALQLNVKNLDLYGYSLGNIVNRYAYEHLGVGKKIGNLTSRVISFAGVNYGIPNAIAAGIGTYIGTYIPSFLIPPPITIATEILGGLTDTPFDPLRSQFMKDLNDNPNPFANKTQYFALAGNNPSTIKPNIDSIPGVGGFVFDTAYQAINGMPGVVQSDAVLSIKNEHGVGLLDGRGRSIHRAIVSTDHDSISGLSSVFGTMLLPGSGYLPILNRTLLPSVQTALTAWLATF